MIIKMGCPETVHWRVPGIFTVDGLEGTFILKEQEKKDFTAEDVGTGCEILLLARKVALEGGIAGSICECGECKEKKIRIVKKFTYL